MKALIVGRGKMGTLLAELLEAQGHEVLGMYDRHVLQELSRLKAVPEVVIDFSHPDNQAWLLPYVKETGAALVCGTTGLSEAQQTALLELTQTNAVFYAANFSYGIAVLAEALRLAAPMLKGSFDMEITETHHRQKVDAPSGTAKLLADVLDPAGEYTRVYGREGQVGARGKEIGMHALRGGTVAGEHSVYFLGQDEELCFTHRAESRRIFANGAIRAAVFVCGKPKGRYSMQDLVRA